MRITILNGEPASSSSQLDGYLQRLAEHLGAEHQITLMTLRDLDVKYCTGCFGCWVKTPGECVAADDSAAVCRAVINADFVLFASPLIMGFVSALLKKVTDKLIPLVHPYIVVDQGEAHHLARYEAYPVLGLLLARGPDADDEDARITTDIYRRTALNFKSDLAFSKLTRDPIEEVVRAIDRL
jgi:hypothetical protein